MMIISGFKKFVFPVLSITAAVFCALPFLVGSGDDVYSYTVEHTPNISEQNFVNALTELGINVRVNEQNAKNFAVWFRSPEQAEKVAESSAKYNFIYNEARYTFEWRKMNKTPIVLTPYRDLFEHYTRSNLKTALLDIQDSKKAAQKFLEILNWLKENNKD